MSTDNQLHKHTSILIVFDSSEERTLLTMQLSELNNCLHRTADLQYVYLVCLLVVGEKLKIN